MRLVVYEYKEQGHARWKSITMAIVDRDASDQLRFSKDGDNKIIGCFYTAHSILQSITGDYDPEFEYGVHNLIITYINKR